ncbi:MAG: MBL fold metallo-hydrolase [Dehalococcoidia bacterium]|nr:MBL fold metallo-hydrolase [Dehalococcoidia bacterium]
MGVEDIDAVVSTHPDADHIAGLLYVLERYEVEDIYLGGGTSGSETFDEWMTLVQDEGADIVTARRGDTIPLGGLELNVLHPTGITGDSNADSVVLQLACGGVEVLLMGDATSESERSMLDAGVIRDTDVLKVGHHGSETSTNPEFLEAAAPEFAVISAGRDSQYGHPHEERRLAAR